MIALRALLTTKLLGFCFFILASVAGLRCLLTPVHISVLCDQKIPFEMQKELKMRIERTALRSVGITHLCAELQKTYPCIQALSIVYKGSLDAVVHVKAYVPWVCLVSALPGNREFMVCKNTDAQTVSALKVPVIEKKYINEQALQGMPTLVIESKEYMQSIANSDLIKCACDLRRNIFDEYTIRWRSKVEIILQCKRWNIIIIADAQTVHDAEKFVYVDRIFNADLDRYKNGMKADIRLKDEIICCPL